MKNLPTFENFVNEQYNVELNEKRFDEFIKTAQDFVKEKNIDRIVINNFSWITYMKFADMNYKWYSGNKEVEIPPQDSTSGFGEAVCRRFWNQIKQREDILIKDIEEMLPGVKIEGGEYSKDYQTSDGPAIHTYTER